MPLQHFLGLQPYTGTVRCTHKARLMPSSKCTSLAWVTLLTQRVVKIIFLPHTLKWEVTVFYIFSFVFSCFPFSVLFPLCLCICMCVGVWTLWQTRRSVLYLVLLHAWPIYTSKPIWVLWLKGWQYVLKIISWYVKAQSQYAIHILMFWNLPMTSPPNLTLCCIQSQ